MVRGWRFTSSNDDRNWDAGGGGRNEEQAEGGVIPPYSKRREGRRINRPRSARRSGPRGRQMNDAMVHIFDPNAEYGTCFVDDIQSTVVSAHILSPRLFPRPVSALSPSRTSACAPCHQRRPRRTLVQRCAMFRRPSPKRSRVAHNLRERAGGDPAGKGGSEGSPGWGGGVRGGVSSVLSYSSCFALEISRRDTWSWAATASTGCS